MTDPNTVYKARFRELTELLGRAPVSSDPGWLAMHDEYKSGWRPAEETVLAPRVRDIASAAGPGDMGFSRQPAPQARTGGADTRTREADREASEPLSGPGINAEGAEAASEPEPPANKPGPAEGPIRGANGGVLAVCVQCGGEWERPARRGRPSYRCETCRG